MAILRQPPRSFRNAATLFLLRNPNYAYRNVPCLLTGFRMKSGGRQALNLSGGTTPQGHKSNARRSTRLSRQISVAITSLDPACNFAGKYETLVVNAHGCGVIVGQQLEREMPMTVEVVANGRIKEARVVVVRPLTEGVSWLLGLEFDHPACDFWGIENPPADWRT